MSQQEPEKLLKRHQALNHLENVKVASHVQREDNEWLQNTLMLDGYDVPFKYRRQRRYRSLAGGRVNVTYYASTEQVAGVDLEIMKVVRLKRS